MTDQKVRVRFAPSPTGFLHLGGARTALFNWLFARHNNGVFVLRIEDTDRQRSTQESIDVILNAMTWMGMDWDEGPFYQTQRLDLYYSALKKLEEKGLAYRCTCTPDQLTEMREEAMRTGKKPRYNRHCLGKYDKDPEGPFVWRFRSPDEGVTVLDDMVRGQVITNNDEMDDLVLIKADGIPTYNFAVVVDDSSMNITHVIRGEDHLTNTPRQINIYKALDLPIPQFAHLPLIKGLSKRIGSTSIQAYQQLGYLPMGVVNYLARLGWSHGDQELFSMDELVKFFTIEGVGKASGTFNPEKMEWVNAQHIQAEDSGVLATHLVPFLAERGIVVASEDPRLTMIVDSLKKRSKTLVEMADASMFYFHKPQTNEKAAKVLADAHAVEILQKLYESYSQLPEPWEGTAIEEPLNALAAEMGIKLGLVAQPMRVALTGSTASPGMFEIIPILGKAEVLKRLESTISDLTATIG